METLKVGTLFSGIGAFEEALRQLGIPHTINFACDSGEIELIPLDNVVERRSFIDYQKRVRSLTEAEKHEYKSLKDKIAKINEDIRLKCYNIATKEARTSFINDLYLKYEGDRINWVKKAYISNYQISDEDFHPDVRFMKGLDYQGEVDVIVGGSPCQSFSTYGKKQGLEDARGTLFYDYARIISECQPKVFIYENVASLLTHDGGRTWEIMQSVFASLGYVIKHKVINAVDFNHPQQRRRLFVIGFRNDVYLTDYQFPNKLPLCRKVTEYLESDVPNEYYFGEKGFKWITTTEKNQHRSRVNRDIIGCQTANQQTNWIGDFRVEHPKPEHLSDDRIYIGQYDFGNGLEDAVGRRLTPRECLNLMGFSDLFKIVVPDKIAYRHAGNSIVVPVLKELIKTILPYLK